MVARQTSSARQATAHHEAGHAVIACVLGCRSLGATIVPGVHSDGSRYAGLAKDRGLDGLRWDVDDSDRAKIRTEKAIKVLLAGPLAQQRYKPRSWRRYHGRSDFEKTVDLALTICGGSMVQVEAFLGWLEIATGELVHFHWRPIEQVAQLLLQQEIISGREVAAVVRAAVARAA